MTEAELIAKTNEFLRVQNETIDRVDGMIARMKAIQARLDAISAKVFADVEHPWEESAP